MENLKQPWPQEKAKKYIRNASVVIILGGISSLVMSADDFIALGRNITGFIFPYFYNIISFILAVFQILAGVAFGKRNQKAKIALFYILGLKCLLGWYDYAELLLALGIIIFLIYVLRPIKAGCFYNEKVKRD